MKILGNEMEARERADIVADNDCQANRRNLNGVPTTSTLIAGDDSSALNCCYCGQSHCPNSCKAVNTTEAKRQILRRSGRCFVCLKGGHIGRYCRSGLKCSSCNGKHYISVCDSTKAASVHPTTSQPPKTPQSSVLSTFVDLQNTSSTSNSQCKGVQTRLSCSHSEYTCSG